MAFIKIYTSTNHMETQRVLDALKQEGIPAYAQEQGAGQYLQISWGMYFIDKDIYVAEEDAKKATLLIESLKQPESVEEQERETFRLPWYKNLRFLTRVWCVVLFVFVCVCIFLSIIFP